MDVREKYPKISVIVPVYNVKPYLNKCIESIIDQTLKEIEIILINDGSTDGSGFLCDEYATLDNRIRVIHKKNEGLSCARNNGIEISSAPYVMFLDGDDWVEPEFCRIPYNEAIEKKADLVLFSYYKWYGSGEKIPVDTKTDTGVLNESKALYFNTHGFHSVWLGLYHRALFEKIRFPEGRLFEDIGTTYKLIHSANTICYINSLLYNYRVNRPGSITTDTETKCSRDRNEMLMLKVKELYAWGYEEYIRQDAFSMLVKYGYKDSNYKILIEIINEIKGFLPKEFSWKQKIMFNIYRVFPKMFDGLCEIKRRKS